MESEKSFRSELRFLVFAGSGARTFLDVEDFVLRLQDVRGAPRAYRPQGRDPLDIERIQLFGVRQRLKQLIRASRQPYGIDQLEALRLFFLA